MKRGITHCGAEARWALGDRWLSLHLEPPVEPAASGRLPYEAIVFIGFDAERGEYIAYWHDTFGARYGSAGRGTRRGNSVEFCFEEDDKSSVYNTFTYDPVSGAWTSLIENKAPGGDRTFFARECYRRRRPR